MSLSSFSPFSISTFPARKSEAATACVACNWVCPPTALQQGRRSERLHCVRPNWYVHTLITPFSSSAFKTHQLRDATVGRIVVGFVTKLCHLSLMKKKKVIFIRFLPTHRVVICAEKHKNMMVPGTTKASVQKILYGRIEKQLWL